MKKTKENKAITLVALVVTIIILLILAGISIASLTGNGLFEKAKLAKEKQENAQIEENSILSDYENKIGKYVSGKRETITLTQEEYQMFKNQTSCSTEEKRIGTWLDNKPLYKCTYNLSDVIVNSTEQKTVICDFTNKKLVKAYGNATWSTNQIVFPYYNNALSNYIQIDIFVKDDNLCYLRTWRATGNTNMTNICVTIEYTKTTE